MTEVSLERIYEILKTYATADDVLRLHMENAERQATVEAQTLRIDVLESELRRRMEGAEAPELEAVPPAAAQGKEDDPEHTTG